MADLRKLKDEATAAFGKGKFGKAAELFEELSKADPKDLQAQMKWGDALAKGGKKDRALGVYQKLAEAYAAEGFLPKAIAVCKVILELDPKHSATQQVLAGLYAKKLGTDVPLSAPRRPVTESAPVRPPVGAAPLAGPGIPRAPSKPSVIVPPPPSPDADAAEAIELDRDDHAQAGFGTAPAPAATGSELPPELDPSLYETPAPAPEAAAAAPAELDAPLELEVELSRAAAAKLTIAAEPDPAPQVAAARAPSRASPQITWGAESSDSIEAQLEHAVDEPDAPVDAALELAADVDDIEIAFDVPMADAEEEEIELLSVTAELPKDLGKPLPKIPLFGDLTAEAFVALMEQCGLIRAEPGQAIVRQGEVGNSFFVVCSGKMKVVKQDAQGQELVMAYLPEGAFFGEMALLSGQKRTATVVAEEESDLLEISAPVLNNLVKRHPHVAASIRQFGRQRLLADVMATSALFRPFERAERKKLVELFKVREVQGGEVVIREGTPTDGLYLVMNGELTVNKGGGAVATLREGDIFGEMSLLSKKPATATVDAKRRSNVLRLPRERFEELIVTYPQVLVLVSELADSRTRASAQTVLAPEDGAPRI